MHSTYYNERVVGTSSSSYQLGGRWNQLQGSGRQLYTNSDILRQQFVNSCHRLDCGFYTLRCSGFCESRGARLYVTLKNPRSQFFRRNGQMWVRNYTDRIEYWYARFSTISGDFNGDGLTDLATISPDASGAWSGHVAVNLSTGSGFVHYNWSSSTPQSMRSGGSNNHYETFSGDFNGDGLADLATLSLNAGGGWKDWISVNLSTGTGFTQQTWVTPTLQQMRTGGSGNQYHTFTGDFNGDGLTDLATISPNASGDWKDWISVNLSTGTGFIQQTWTTATPQQMRNGGSSNKYHTFTGDFNGDGLTDLATISPNASGDWKDWISVNLSTGTGFRQETWATPTPQDMRNGGSNNKYHTFADDFNGDGLTDLVTLSPDATGDWRNWNSVNLSTSTGFTHQTWSTQTPQQMRNGGSSSQYHTFTGDFNGDGLADLATLSPNAAGNWRNWMSMDLAVAKPLLLESIIQEGKTFAEINYQPLSNTTLYQKGNHAQGTAVDIAHSGSVVARIKRDNGLGGLNTQSYHYAGLQIDRLRKTSLGFAKITQTDHLANKTLETTFLQNHFALAGRVKQTRTQSGNTLIDQARYDYRVEEQDNRSVRVNTAKIINQHYDLQGQLVKTTTSLQDNIDDFGNVGLTTNTTETTNSRYQAVTENTYENNVADWVLGLLTSSRHTYQSDNADDVVREQGYEYDSHGLITAKHIIGGQSGDLLRSTRYIYDNYGQLTESRLSAQGQADRVSTISYNTLGQVIEKCNALEECQSFSYEPQGWLEVATDVNGLQAIHEYDDFGRITRVTHPDASATQTQRYFIDDLACGEAAPYATHCTVKQTTGSAPTVVQIDSLGRKLRQVNQHVGERKAFKDFTYNAKGLLASESREYYLGNEIYWTYHKYDALDRPILTREDSPSGISKEVQTHYDGLRTTVTRGDGQQSTTTTDARGNKIKVEEEEGVYSEFAYTSDGLLRFTRIAGEVKTEIHIHFDEFGRKVQQVDPDMGTWYYTYNGFDELIQQTDAKGQVITNEYDVLGRTVKQTTPEGVNTWRYGRAGGIASEPVGKLIASTGGGLTTTFAYDHLARQIQETRRSDQGVLVTRTEYDDVSRVKRIHYPGKENFVIENHFNENGVLVAISGPRITAESHDSQQLMPLIHKAIDLADNYQQQAQKLRDIGTHYVQRAKLIQDAIDDNSVNNNSTNNNSIDNNANANTDNTGIPELHQETLSTTISNGQSLLPEFMGHLHNSLQTLKELQKLIDQEVTSLEKQAWQYLILAEQTLAAADRRFQVAHTVRASSNLYSSTLQDPNHLYYWQVADVDADGRISADVYGNGLVNDYSYNPANGQLDSIHTSLLSFAPLRHLEYQYDSNDNLILRHDLVTDIAESFDFDRLNRLTRTSVAAAAYSDLPVFQEDQVQTYDALGNIIYKSDVGDYYYGDKAHRVLAAGNATYHYDANGNMLSGSGRTLTWNSHNKPTSISRNDKSVSFRYDANNNRYQKRNHLQETTLYAGRYFEQTTSNNKSSAKHYIYAGNHLVAEHIVERKKSSTSPVVHTRYLHRDTLESVDLITDAQANVVDRRSFDAWGERRNLPWKDVAKQQDPLFISQLAFTNKGYTGHETVPEVGLIHMNGRVYDGKLGRFISPDVFIQDSRLSQNYNRYSYVLNNPLRYNDPTGHFFRSTFNTISSALGSIGRAISSVFRGGNRASKNLSRKASTLKNTTVPQLRSRANPARMKSATTFYDDIRAYYKGLNGLSPRAKFKQFRSEGIKLGKEFFGKNFGLAEEALITALAASAAGLDYESVTVGIKGNATGRIIDVLNGSKNNFNDDASFFAGGVFSSNDVGAQWGYGAGKTTGFDTSRIGAFMNFNFSGLEDGLAGTDTNIEAHSPLPTKSLFTSGGLSMGQGSQGDINSLGFSFSFGITAGVSTSVEKSSVWSARKAFAAGSLGGGVISHGCRINCSSTALNNGRTVGEF